MFVHGLTFNHPCLTLNQDLCDMLAVLVLGSHFPSYFFFCWSEVVLIYFVCRFRPNVTVAVLPPPLSSRLYSPRPSIVFREVAYFPHGLRDQRCTTSRQKTAKDLCTHANLN